MSYRQIPQNAVDQMVCVTLPTGLEFNTPGLSAKYMRTGEAFQAIELVERADATGEHISGGWTAVGGNQYVLCLPDDACVGDFTRLVVECDGAQDIIDIDLV